MEKGQIECKNCENTDYTTYQDEQGQIECKRCPKGKYETEQGQTSCKTCQNGFTTNTLGSNVCSMCEPGYRGIGGLCYTCNHAEYQDEYGQVECKLCPGGQFAPVDGKGHTECQTCPLGYYGLNKYKDPIEYKLINTKEWMRNCDACPTKNYWGHGRCSVFTETTKSECASAGGNWKTYEKCRDIPGNEIWDTTIRTKYECRDAWLNFLTNDEKEELLQDGTFPPQNDKYQPVCSYAPGKKCQPSTCSDPNEKWEYPPSIYFNPKSIMLDKNIKASQISEYTKLDGQMAVCKVRVQSTKMPSYLIDTLGAQCHKCPSGQFSTKEGVTVFRDENNVIISNRCAGCLYEEKCTRCDWGRYSRPDRIFGEKTYEQYMQETYGKSTEWPPKEQYYCSTCPAGWDSTARTFTWSEGTEHELDASDGCVQCTPGTYSRFVETSEYEHDLGKYGRYKGHSGYIVADGFSNDASSVNDYQTQARKYDYFKNKNIVLQHKGCSRCEGKGEYQDEFGQSSCKTCSDAGLEDTPLDEVLAHVKEFIECVPEGEPGVGTPHHTSPDGYDCYHTNNVNLGLFSAWNEQILIMAHGMKWIKCRNATSALAPYWYATNWEGDIGTGAGAHSNLHVWDEYYDKDTHSSGYKKDVYAHKLERPRPAQILLQAARQKNKLELASVSPIEEDICSLSYMYSDSRIENMTKEELLDAMKELSNVLLRRGTATDLLPYDVPMFSVKTLYNTQDTCSELEAGLCNYLNFESFTCSDTEIVGQTIPVTGLTREKLAALFTCGNPMANVCQNSALNLTSWECI